MKLYWKNIAYLFKPLPEPVIKKYVLERQKANETIKSLKEEGTALQNRIKELLAKLSGEVHPSKTYWDEKHEERIINYDARNLPYTNTRIKMDVRTFITPDDITVRRWARRNKELECSNPLFYDHLVRNFYLRDRQDFFYAYDENTAKVSEVWMFPFELDEAGRGDCEDHAHRMKSRLNALGLPDWRSRIVCGTARNGEGHSTVYYLADDLETWVHLNSTTPESGIGVTLPTKDDPNDGLGIKEVWFSFNKERSWADFEEPNSDAEVRRFKNVQME